VQGLWPETSPAFQLLIAINTPLALPQAWVFRWFPGWWDRIALIVAIGVFWHWVAMNVASWRERRMACMFSSEPLRVLADLAVIGVGVFWMAVVWGWVHHPNERLFSLQERLWHLLLLALPALWSVLLVALFGYDCILSFLRIESAE